MKDLLRILLIVLKLIAKNDGVVHKFVELMNKNAQFDFNDIVKENEEANTFNSYQENCALRIVGGVNAPISKVPYQVVLRRSSKNGLLWFSFCGGSLVTLSFLLSASHCFDFPDFYKWKNKVRAVAGTEITDANLFTFRKEHSRRIKHYYIHRNYSAADWKNDISVLEVQHPFIESENIKPIRMHTPDMKVNLSIGSICLVSGFGLLENDQRSKRLQMVCVPLVSSSKCSEMYMQPIFSFNLCAGEYTKDSCGGDSGGPLVCSGVLVGLVSWGSVCGAYPGVYTRLASYTGEKTVPFMKKAGNNLEASLYLIIVTILCIL